MHIVVHRAGAEYEVALSVADESASLGEITESWFEETPAAFVIDGVVRSGGTPLRDSGLRSGSVLIPLSVAGTIPESMAYGAVVPGRPSSGSRAPFNRPPRSEYPMSLPAIEVPAAPPAARASTRFGWGALVVPLVLGLVMAVLFHPRMALFALFSPAMMLANWMEDRRRNRLERATSRVDFDRSLTAFEERLVGLAAAAARLEHRELPHPDGLMASLFAGSPRMWERRAHHPDAMRLGIGSGNVPWSPSLITPPAGAAEEAQAIVAAHGELRGVPVEVELRPGTVAGLVGDRRRVLGVARALLVQAAILHGPADLEMTVVTDSPSAWDWIKWLPHVELDPARGMRRLGADREHVERAVAALLEGIQHHDGDDQPIRLLVVDVVNVAADLESRVREGLAAAARGHAAAIAVATSVSELPSVCTSIVLVDEVGAAELTAPAENRSVGGFHPWVTTGQQARRAARILSGFRDPDLVATSAELPHHVRLSDLLGVSDPTPDAIVRRWRGGGDVPRPAAPIGVTAGGPLIVDLVVDGPHALLAGTTGSGKSELLRTLVASLAATNSPDHLTFVLIDYKGGSAFDVCADLPHTVGLVTDLDGHLATRALTCLEAELRYREQRLRAAAASDLTTYLAGDEPESLPRLLVIIDEFAALAKELPAFMTSLVDIAQRGRSLGVHLLLATQRPGGVISDNIRANTNLRMALRVQDGSDSTDVLGIPDAAAIGRTQPGRGLVRRGPGDVVPFQAALVTMPRCDDAVPAVEVRPFVFGYEQPEPVGTRPTESGVTDLGALVEAVAAATTSLELEAPRRPWPEPLGIDVTVEHLDVTPPDELHRARIAIPLGLADEPAHQRQRTAWWSSEDGNLLLYGVPGSGTTTALATIALGAARHHSPDDVHVYVLDLDDQRLAPLVDLPHVGAVVGAGERERQLRLLRYLQAEVEARRVAVAADPSVLGELPALLVLVDNYAGLAAAFDEPADMAVRSILPRVAADGPGVAIHVVAAAKQPVDIPAQLGSLVPAKLAFRLTDRYEYGGLGVPVAGVPEISGRAYQAGTGREIQIANPHPGGIATAVDALADQAVARRPHRIEVLPAEVKVPDVIDAARIFDLEWVLPIGIGDHELRPVGFLLGEGDHVVVAGPPRSGKSTALTTMASVVASHRPDVTITAVAPRRSPLRDCPDVTRLVSDPGQFEDALSAVPDGGTPHLVLVDDAAMVDDEEGWLAAVVACRRPEVHLVAADQADSLRAAYGHWTKEVRRSRIGLALKPHAGSDGDLWQTPLPRRGPQYFPPGRGYLLADGRCELIQTAWQ
jgi:S-DNA-T family DNA segregation ATPase FtsK/SpoIIIE